MAGGIDWFRWHHGSVTDPKFQLVARKSKQSLPSVIAVWAYVLEKASEAEQRGFYGELDCEAVDCMFGMDDGATEAILCAMADRGLLADGCVCAWDKRQVKRERTDDNSTGRSKAFRQRQRHETPETDDATPCNATQRQETPRGEERREEEYQEPTGSVGRADQKPTIPRCDVQAMVALYHEHLPELPTVRLMTDERRKRAGAFWRFVLTSKRSDGTPRATTAAEALDWIGGYFARARDNDFLMGRGGRASGHENWQCDFDFLLTEKGKKHVIEKTQAVPA